MAVKDHSLDEKIVAAAKAEFLEHGFQKASLHKIADRAGITTGALYTRYKNKDALFCSLVEGAFSNLQPQFEVFRRGYMEVQQSGSAEALLSVLRQEEQFYLELLFDHYEECVLFFCRSDGSSIQKLLEQMMELKATQTVDYLKSIARREYKFDGLEFLLCEQFRYYRLVLEKGYDKQRAMTCMRFVEHFLEAGWKDLFEQIL